MSLKIDSLVNNRGRMRKTILYVDEQGTRLSGGSSCLFNLISQLDKDNFTPIIACREGDLTGEYRARGIEVDSIKFPHFSRVSFKKGRFRFFYPHRLFSNLLRLCPLVRKLVSIIRRKKVDLLHTNSFRANIAGFLAAKWTGKPIIWHIRDFAHEESIFIRIAGRKFVDRVIFMSKATKRSFTSDGANRPNMEVIYDGVDPDVYSPQKRNNKLREKFGISSSVRLVGIVGRLVPWKGHRYFLEAARRIADEIEDVKFLIVGENLPESQERNSYPEIECLIEKRGLRDKVILTGFQSDIVEVMNALDLLVCPSLAEPFGMVVIEALACGTPVIGTDAGGIKEILSQGGGILVSSRDAEAIACEVVNLLGNDRALIDLSKAGRCNVKQNFGLDGYVAQVEKLYQEVLG